MKRFWILLLFPLILTGLARAILYFVYPVSFASLSATQALLAYFSGFRFGISVVFTLFAVPSLFLSIIPVKYSWHKIWERFWFIIYIILLYITSFALITDLVFFNFGEKHITNEFEDLLSNVDLGEITSLLKGYFVYIILLAVVFAVSLYFSKYVLAKLPQKKLKWFYIPVLFVIVFFGARGSFDTKPINIVTAYQHSFAEGALKLNGLFTMYRSSALVGHGYLAVKHDHFPFKQALAIATGKKYDAANPYPLIQDIPHDPTKHIKPNLFIIVVESLSYKYVNGLGMKKVVVTPYLEKLLKKSAVFTHFFANGPRSVVGLQAVLTGLPPVVGQELIASGLTSRVKGLGNIAVDNGYNTIFLQASKRNSYRLDLVAAEAGYKEQYGSETTPLLLDYKDKPPFGWDYDLLMRSLKMANKQTKPFIIAEFTGTTHYPYVHIPKSIPIHQFPYSRTSINGLYNTLLYTDWSIHEFLEEAKKQPWFKNTIFLITADHTNQGFNRGGFPEEFHTPLIIYSPALVKPQVITDIGSQIDIMPTMAKLLNLKGQLPYIGRDLFSPPTKYSGALTTIGVTTGWITNKEYMLHTLSNVIQKGTFDPSLKYTDEQWKTVENRLLANHQVVYDLVRNNKWTK